MESVVQRGRGKRESYKANGERFSYNANFHKLVRNSFIFLCSFLQNSTSMWGTHCVWPAAGKEQSAMRVRQSKVMWAECGGGGDVGEHTCMEPKRILDLYFHMEYVSWFATARISNFSHTHQRWIFICMCVCVCVFVIWIKLWNSHTHALTHTWRILQQTTKGLSSGSRRERGMRRFLHSCQRYCPTPTASSQHSSCSPPPPLSRSTTRSGFAALPLCRSITFCFSTFGSLRQSFVILVVVADIVIAVVVVIAGQACSIYIHVHIHSYTPYPATHMSVCMCKVLSDMWVHIICMYVLYALMCVCVCACICVCACSVCGKRSLWQLVVCSRHLNIHFVYFEHTLWA